MCTVSGLEHQVAKWHQFHVCTAGGKFAPLVPRKRGHFERVPFSGGIPRIATLVAWHRPLSFVKVTIWQKIIAQLIWKELISDFF